MGVGISGRPKLLAAFFLLCAFGTGLVAESLIGAAPAGATDPAFSGIFVDANGTPQPGWGVAIDGTPYYAGNDGTFVGSVADGTHTVQLACPTQPAPSVLHCPIWGESFSWNSSSHSLRLEVPDPITVPYKAFNKGAPVAGASQPDDGYMNWLVPSASFSPLGDGQSIHFIFSLGNYTGGATDAAGEGTFLAYAEDPSYPYVTADTNNCGSAGQPICWVQAANSWVSRLSLGTAAGNPLQTLSLSPAVVFESGMPPLTFNFDVVGPPSIPADVTVTPGDSSAAVSWTAPNDDGSAITGYIVQYTTDEGTTLTTASMCTGTSTSCTVTGLSNDSVYQFSVTATNGQGTGSPSPLTTPVRLSSGSSPGSGGTSAPPPPGVSSNDLGTPTSATISSSHRTTISVDAGESKASVSVPAGALPEGTIVSVYPVINSTALAKVLPSGCHLVASFVVSWKAPDGSSPDATAPISMIVVNPSIKAGNLLYEIVNGVAKQVGTATTDGTATIMFSDDPVLAVSTPSSVLASLANTGSSLSLLAELTAASLVAGFALVALQVTLMRRLGRRSRRGADGYPSAGHS